MSIKAAGEDDFTKLCFEMEIRLIVSIRHLELYGFVLILLHCVKVGTSFCAN